MPHAADDAGTDAVTGAPPRSDAWVARLARTPLLAKVVIFDLVIDVIVIAVMQVTPAEYDMPVTVLSLAAVLVVNAALIAWALGPLRVLEDTAVRVTRGAYDARVGRLPFGVDAQLARIGGTFDALLDRVDADRTRLRGLAALVVASADQERARIARELHDGTAQSLSALDMLLARLLTDAADSPLRPKLQQLRDVVTDALAEVRSMAQAMHPRVLDDLGLPAALEHLARLARSQTSAGVEVRLDGEADVPPEVASALYRVAQEALHNAVKHARAKRIDVWLGLDPARAALTVTDDGVGIDARAPDDARRGMGLFVMEERLVVVGGRLRIAERAGGGTVVSAVVPLGGAG